MTGFYSTAELKLSSEGKGMAGLSFQLLNTNLMQFSGSPPNS